MDFEGDFSRMAHGSLRGQTAPRWGFETLSWAVVFTQTNLDLLFLERWQYILNVSKQF